MIQVLEIRIGTLKVSTLTCLIQATLIKYIFPDVWLQSIIQTDILQRFIFSQPIWYNLVRHNKKWNIFSLNKMEDCWNPQVEVCPILIVIYPPPGWLARSVSEEQGVPGPAAAQVPVPMALEGLRGGQPSEMLLPKLRGVQYFPLPDFFVFKLQSFFVQMGTKS